MTGLTKSVVARCDEVPMSSALSHWDTGDGTYRLSEELGKMKAGSCTNRGSVLLAWAPLHRGKMEPL
ncbi:hypothetical protein WJX82_009301 [Trebouxia sp. C0006]